MKEKLQNLKNQMKSICGKIPTLNIYFKILFIVIAMYLLIFFNIEKIEKNMTFPGIGKEVTYNITIPENLEEINVQMADGNIIHGVYLGDGEGKTVYYFHGNGVPLPYFYNEIEYIHSLGVNVMAYDYPGYGKSTGDTTQKNIAKYSQIFYKDLQAKKNIKDEDVIVWGLSIGTAAAADFAGRNEFDKLIFVSPMASRYEMAAKMFGFPIQKLFFRKNTFNTQQTVQYFSQPVVIIHGNADQVIPFEQGKSVYNNYGIENNKGNQKYFIELDNFGHNGIISQYGSALEAKLLKFINSGKIIGDDNIQKITSENIKKFEEESKIYKNIFGADLETDHSITKFVNSSVPFNDKAYIPEDLVNFTGKYISSNKPNPKLREVMVGELEGLAEAFFTEFGTKLQVNSAYRSYAYQKGIKDRGCPDNLCAKAGYSEHQSGLGFDIFSISNQATWLNNKTLSAYYSWLKIHAHHYGFHNTYQKGLEIDGYEIEPWHWRYVGVDLATYLSENDITIAEFYYSQKKND